MKTEDIAYRDGALNMRGLAVWDDSKPGNGRVCWWCMKPGGLGEHVIERAQMLAKLGYVALCADMYGDRKQIGTMDK